MLADQFDEMVRLSEGATSVVYRARRLSDRRKVVLKVLRGPHPHPRDIQEFRKEFYVAAALQGDGLTPPLAFLDGAEPTIVYDDLSAVSTSALVADGALAPLDVVTTGIDIARALATLHGAGVLHRDVSAANIVRSTSSGHAWLIDFGLSTQMSRENFHDSEKMRGTLLYISPEQTGRTNCRVDERSDLYSLGATLYHLVVGRPPFVAPDALGVLHGHLARPPHAPSRLREGVPGVLSDIILHCLQKSPEERYQSAAGLLEDLLVCERMLRNGIVEPFTPGTRDRSRRVRTTDALVGRESEIETLREVYRATRAGRSRVVAVKGWSGIGKTRLVQELIPDVTADQGAFVSGKHELLGRGLPYSALAQGFGNWVRRVVGDPAESLATTRERVRDALGDGAAALAAIIPELPLLLGDVGTCEPLPPAEAESRIAVMFRALIRGIAGPQRPLVLFLDDLQWCDTASLQVIETVATEPGSQHVLLVVAWRDNEVPAGHPVLGLMDDLSSRNADVTTIELGPLSAAATVEFVARSLQTTAREVRDLGVALYGASGGSPFYAGRLLTGLSEDRALSFNGTEWVWNRSLGALADAPQDAVMFLLRRLRRLELAEQRALAVGAWLGSSFALPDVAQVLKLDLRSTGALLQTAVHLDAIHRCDDSPVEIETLENDLDRSLAPRYRFAHDRVQQAASELVAEAERAALRLEIARMFSTSDGMRVYEAVDHAIAAEDLLTDSAERRTFARLALSTGRQAVDAAAFSVARRAFEKGLQWNGADAWSRTPELALALELGAAEACYLDADRDGMERHVSRVLSNSRDPVARLRAEEIAGLAHISANEMGAAIDRVSAAISGAGMALPSNPTMLHVVRGLVQTKWALLRHSSRSLAALPECKDALVKTRMRLEAALFSPAFYGRPLMFPLLAFTLVRESVAHGVTAETPLGLCVYGIVLCTTGDIAGGISYGRTALALNERLHDRRLRYRTQHIWNAHLRFWFEPWQVCRDDLKLIHRGCWESGDIEYAAFAAFMSCTLGLHTGEPLPELRARNARAIEAIRSMGQQTALHTTLMHHQIIENFLGLSDDPTRLVGEAYDEGAMEAVHRAANDRVNLHCLAVSRAVVAVHFGKMAEAAATMRAADPWDQDARSQPLHVVGRFYDALAHAAIGDTKRARRQLAELRKWSKVGQSSLAHRIAMIDAELAAQGGQVSEAMAAWESAFSLAEVHGYGHERALALERAANFHEQQRNASMARLTLLEARAAYERWGARAKVVELDQRLIRAGRAGAEPARRKRTISSVTATDVAVIQPVVPIDFQDTSPGTSAHRPVRITRTTDPGAPPTSATVSTQTEDAPLDLEALLAAARRIAAEVEGRGVTAALLEGVLVLAGGSTATLYRVQADGFRAVVRATADADRVQSTQVDEPPIYSALLADAVRAARQVVVPKSSHPFFQDPELRAREARSAVAIPIVHGGHTTAALLVTHSSLEEAFPERRMAPIQALAAQAAIALENALHYEELDARVRARTAELLAARREAEAERDRADRILSNVLPEPIAEELKRTGKATPVSVASATVLFTDFEGFTGLAAEMSAETLVSELERCFAAFDDIVDRHQVTKLKTIGDAYMAVGGLPNPNDTHARDVVRAGLEMASWIENPSDGGSPIPFRVRIGIHTGPLVAGVIGKRRFLYDVWGDTVNVAARMESSGEPGRVNISQETLNLLGDGFRVVPRGRVAAKGKGELEMYFVEGESR